MTEPLRMFSVSTPIGELRAVLRGERLVSLAFADTASRAGADLSRRFGSAASLGPARPRVTAALGRYFDGDLRALESIEIDPGGTPFQRAVWDALREVPAGRTVFYGAIARHIGLPTAARAVGAACGANPVWLAIPCHRAIGNDGRLVGYAGGIARKRWLLEHEGALPRPRGHDDEAGVLSSAAAFAQR
ncbi:Methylated-DNA--protein-cysteine methyltransferase [Myxococcaceae bacterium]|nr:Methylated-DNA--protein-cysteine methyltransferase [Myxococcaceae bacterium]